MASLKICKRQGVTIMNAEKIIAKITPSMVKVFLESMIHQEVQMIDENELEKCDLGVYDVLDKSSQKMYFVTLRDGTSCAIFSCDQIWIKNYTIFRNAHDYRYEVHIGEEWKTYLASIFGEEYIEYYKVKREREYQALKSAYEKTLYEFRGKTEQKINEYRNATW